MGGNGGRDEVVNPYYWYYLCDVDIAPLLAWLVATDVPWPEPSTPTKPQRVHEPGLPTNLLQPIFGKVFACFTTPVMAVAPMLSRVLAGQSHPMHVDQQRSDWITRVHVPITTNLGCWMAWEHVAEASPLNPLPIVFEERIHFEAGKAYSFNTLDRHSFGNDGETARVHLIVEGLRNDAT